MTTPRVFHRGRPFRLLRLTALPAAHTASFGLDCDRTNLKAIAKKTLDRL